ncbi:MAG: PaRep2b protein [Pyrobaculum sp.]|mgnify:CR=1 FL=1|jgi:hypothetical protein
MQVGWVGLRRTEGGCAAARLTLSDGASTAEYNVYLLNDIRLIFQSADRSRVERAAGLLRRVGVDAEVKKMGWVWYVQAYTDILATGREELKKAVADIVREAAARGWVDGRRAERWLKKLERGSAVRRGWPKYLVRVMRSGALEIRFASTNPGNIEREAQRLKAMGLEEGRHFTVKRPEEGRDGYVRILRGGLSHAAWLSARGRDERQRRLAAELVEYILQRAEGIDAVYRKVRGVVEEGRARGSLTLSGFEGMAEVGSRVHVVRVVDWSAGLEEGQGGRKLLKIEITAEVDGVRCRLAVAFGRYGRKNETAGYARARAGAPGGREADAERLSALVKALTGVEPRVYRRKNSIIIVCSRVHLEGFRRFAELAEAVERWLGGR